MCPVYCHLLVVRGISSHPGYLAEVLVFECDFRASGQLIRGDSVCRYLDGVHDDSEAGHGELVGIPQVMVVQVSEQKKKNTKSLFAKRISRHNKT